MELGFLVISGTETVTSLWLFFFSICSSWYFIFNKYWRLVIMMSCYLVPTCIISLKLVRLIVQSTWDSAKLVRLPFMYYIKQCHEIWSWISWQIWYCMTYRSFQELLIVSHHVFPHEIRMKMFAPETRKKYTYLIVLVFRWFEVLLTVSQVWHVTYRTFWMQLMCHSSRFTY